MWKTEKQVSHIFTAPWKTRSRKKRGWEFPTAYTGLTSRVGFFLGWEQTNPSGLRGEYPIEVWHGENLCPSLSEEIKPAELRVFRFGTVTKRILHGSKIRTEALQMSNQMGTVEICLDI